MAAHAASALDFAGHSGDNDSSQKPERRKSEPAMPEHLRLDPELAEKAEKLFLELGLDLSTAIHLFLRQSLRENALPFTLRLTAPAAVTSGQNEEKEVCTPAEEAGGTPPEALEDADAALAEELEGQSFGPANAPDAPAPAAETATPAKPDEEQLSGIRQAFYDMGILGTPLRRVRTLNQIYAIGEANRHVQGWRETYVSGDEPFALDFGAVRVELGYRNGGSLRMMDGRLPDDVLEADAVYPRDLSAVFSAVMGQRLTDVSTVRVHHEHGDAEQLRLRFANDCTLVFAPRHEWAALWLCDQHGSVMFAPEPVWRRSLGERAWQALR